MYDVAILVRDINGLRWPGWFVVELSASEIKIPVAGPFESKEAALRWACGAFCCRYAGFDD